MPYSIENHKRLKPKPEPSFSKKPFKGKDKNRKGNKTKTCKECGKKFTPSRDIQPTCNNFECLLGYADKHLSKNIKEKAKQSNREKKEFNWNDKTWLKNEAQKQFNKFIRLRDKDEPCISCGYDFNRPQPRQAHASHYRPATNSNLRFNEKNVWKSCQICNTHLSGNLANYRIALIEKIGLEEVEALESNNGPKRFTVEELRDIIETYKKKIKEL